nr:NADH dehydrogenase subunit 3 [Amblyseius tsugawai]
MLNSFMALLLSLILLLISTLKMNSNQNKEKLNSFECGFNPMMSPRSSFSLQFFKVLMIFMLFDMEILIVLPCPIFKMMNFNSFLIIILIMVIIIFGLIFEWKEGSLQWLK